MKYAVKPPSVVAIAVKGSDASFPVRRVYCVGRNYNDHVAEMGGTPGREPPFFFQKPADAIVTNGRFPYPPASSDVHHELELVVALASGGGDIQAADALGHVFGYAVGLDMTRRDLQAQLKKGGRPWEAAKAFDHSAPVSAIVPASDIGGAGTFALLLTVNGVVRQKGSSADMIWSVAEIICELSKLFELAAGDIIFTGTPSGVGAVQRGDVLTASLSDFTDLTVTVV
jgi:fumarylpyruvate hydrolase